MRHDSPQYVFVARLLCGDAPDPGRNWNWDETVRCASREDVLASVGSEFPAPDEVVNFFCGIKALNAERNRQLLAEVESHAVLLNQAGLEPVLLKGVAYLATSVYCDSSHRLLRDIDFLLSPGQASAAFDLIHAEGYEPFAPNPTASVLHHFPALTKLHFVPVEIHHSLGLGACEKFLTADEIVADSTRMTLGQATVRVPSPEHLMTHLIVHSQMQHGLHERIWPSLRSMLDLVRITQRFEVPWEPIRARFGSHRKTALLETHLLQVQRVLGLALPFEIRRRSVRWWYRQALWREPRLRYVDPMYTFARIVVPKIRLGRRLLRSSEGRRYILGTLFRRSFYRKLLDGIAHG